MSVVGPWRNPFYSSEHFPRHEVLVVFYIVERLWLFLVSWETFSGVLATVLVRSNFMSYVETSNFAFAFKYVFKCVCPF